VSDDLTETRDAFRALTPAESLLGMAQAVQQLSRNIVKLVEKLDACDARLNQFETIERGLAELLLLLARQRVPNHTLIAAAPASELNALSHDITEIRQTEKQIQGSLQSIEGALSHIADRLTLIEAKIHGEIGCPPASQLPLIIEEGRLGPPTPTPAEVADRARGTPDTCCRRGGFQRTNDFRPANRLKPVMQRCAGMFWCGSQSPLDLTARGHLGARVGGHRGQAFSHAGSRRQV
jgi:hypothetical protein